MNNWDILLSDMDSKNQIKNMVEKLSQKVNHIFNPESVSIKDTCTKKSVENILKETQKKLDVVHQRQLSNILFEKELHRVHNEMLVHEKELLEMMENYFPELKSGSKSRQPVLTDEMMMANINKMRALKGINPVADLPVIRYNTVQTYPVLYEGSCRDDGAWIEGVWY